jgi:hypothetical protein
MELHPIIAAPYAVPARQVAGERPGTAYFGPLLQASKDLFDPRLNHDGQALELLLSLRRGKDGCHDGSLGPYDKFVNSAQFSFIQ